MLIIFQSGKPELWIETGEQVRAWVNDDRSVDFFEEADTVAGSSLHEEGEEEKRTGDDDFQPGENRKIETEMKDPMAMVEIEKDQRVVADLGAPRCWLS